MGKERAFLEFGCHGGVDESRFDGQDGYAAFREAAAQTLQEDGDCSFGGSIDVVAGTTPVSGYGCDDGDTAVALLFEVVGDDGQEGDDAGEVGGEFFDGFGDALLAELLVSEGAVGDEDSVETAKGIYGGLYELLVLVEVVEVEMVSFYTRGASHLEIVFDGVEFFGVACDEVEVGVVFSEVFCCFVCDGGGGAYDEYFLGFHGCFLSIVDWPPAAALKEKIDLCGYTPRPSGRLRPSTLLIGLRCGYDAPPEARGEVGSMCWANCFHCG